MHIEVLGPIRAWRDATLLDLGPTARRAVLGLLALAGGRPLTRSEIMAGLWPDRRHPPSAANVIQTQVKHLRRLLEPGRQARDPSTVLPQVGDGYRLHAPVDLLAFRGRVASAVTAQREGRLDRAADLLEQAIALWYGAPLADIPVLASHPVVIALVAERQAALGRYGEVMLALGRPVDGLSALEEAAAAQPLNEAWQAHLIRAYQAAGRRGEAFATYHVVRRRLADELGVDPGPELATAHAALLHDPAPDPRPAGTEPAAHGAGPVPAQLPADLPHFVGRQAELARLRQMSGAVVITGAPGVGKTALALRWAHRVRHLFPDGQLYVNLRGFDPTGVVMDAGEAVRRFLDALGGHPEPLPSGLDAQAALYRGRLVGRRVLIVLDNARDAEQVRPLLPGSSGSLVLVTSRDQLGSLVTGGAHPLLLEPLPPDDARELLARRVGAARAAGEPEAVAQIIDRCAGLPLALAVIGARAAINAHLSLTSLADQLRRQERLDALSTGDASTDLRAVLSWSYRALSPRAARLFRLLGLHPGPEISTAAAASLAAVAHSEVQTLLTELVRANLVVELTTGRYALHDLLRAYASEAGRRTDRLRQRHAASRRMLDHYLHSAHAATRLLYPVRMRDGRSRPAPGVVPERPAGHDSALAWFTAERAVLLAAVDHATDVSSRHTWQLASALCTFLDRRGHWADLATTQRAAVAAAERACDPAAQADGHRFLARAYIRLGRPDDAHVQLLRALELYRHTDDRSGEADTHANLSLMWERQGRFAEALDHARRSLEAFTDVGDRHGQARALNAVGWYHALLGSYQEALTFCQEALADLQELDDRASQANTWDSLGYAHLHLGDHGQALAAFRHAIDLYRDLGDRHLGALVMTHLGDAHQATGDAPAAGAAWREALSTLDELGQHDDAARVRTKLSSAPPMAPHRPAVAV